jgi:hypothetical protein
MMALKNEVKKSKAIPVTGPEALEAYRVVRCLASHNV